MAWLQDLFTRYPELAVFLAIGVGYWIGGLRVAGFNLGGVTGALLAGIAIGLAFDVPIAASAKSLVFLLFLFGIGYSVGPRFATAMRGDGWRYAVLGVFVPAVGLLTAWAVATFLSLDAGLAAGLLSGALTESPAMGTASEAIAALPIDDLAKQRLVAHIGVADALCYVFGALGVVVFCAQLAPRLLRIDLKAEAQRLERRFGIERNASGVVSAWQPFEWRAYRIKASGPIVGQRVSEAEALFDGERLSIARVRHEGRLSTASPDLVLHAGDVVAVSARRDLLVALGGGERAQEIEDRELLDLPIATREVLVQRAEVAGHRLGELAHVPALRGVYLKRIVRFGLDIPIGTHTVIERGDVLHLTGVESAIERAVAIVGTAVNRGDATDFVAVGLAIFAGAAFGVAVAFEIGGVGVSLGTSVGTLLAGIVVGWQRSMRPLFGRVPDAAVQFMQSLGLAGFVCMVGIGAGPHFVEAVRTSGLGLFLGGVVVTTVPLLAALYVGRYVLRIEPLLLLGAIAGAQTFTPGLAAVQERSASPIAVLGYSGSVAIAHVLLTTFGTAIVLLVGP